MAHSNLARQGQGRRFVSNFRWVQRPLCIAAATLTAATVATAALGLQATVSQAGPAQVRSTSASSSAMAEAAFAVQPIAGQLAARDADGQVNIRRQPAVRSPILSQGYNQDSLHIFKSALTPQGQRWYFIENISTGEQGWVHGDYVRLNDPGHRFARVPAGAMRIDPMTGTVDWKTPHAVEEQPEGGIIAARDVGAWVNVRSQPSTNSPIRHTGRPGDSVYIYRTAQFSSPAGQVRVKSLWYFVAFLDSGAEGWVHSDFIESAWESDEPFEVSGFGPKAGQLRSNGQDSKVQLYQHPSVGEKAVAAQGQAGEVVTLLRKLETARGNAERTWYWVRLAGGQEGWASGLNVLEQS